MNESPAKAIIESMSDALREARDIIMVIGTTGVERPEVYQKAQEWLKKYYPEWAD